VEAVLTSFSREKRGRKAEPFIRYIKEKADTKISLAQVRQELSSIKGKLFSLIKLSFIKKVCYVDRKIPTGEIG